jgi:D-glycero-D-manno-heptose 1,7-bisphosphate phosphatase
MNKAIFLDRDGVINQERDLYTFGIDEFILNDGLIEALKAFIDKGYLLIVITNQGGIAKGLYTHQDVETVHNYLMETLAKEGIHITDIYYCPHHPDQGKCLCRKPGSLMLEKAIARYNIDAGKSYFIGDNDRDITAGNAVGVNTILIPPNTPLTTLIDKVV